MFTGQVIHSVIVKVVTVLTGCGWAKQNRNTVWTQDLDLHTVAFQRNHPECSNISDKDWTGLPVQPYFTVPDTLKSGLLIGWSGVLTLCVVFVFLRLGSLSYWKVNLSTVTVLCQTTADIVLLNFSVVCYIQVTSRNVESWQRCCASGYQ